MVEELEKPISEKQKDRMSERINELYNEGVLKVRDWMAIYDVFISACNAEEARTYEELLTDSISGGDAEC